MSRVRRVRALSGRDLYFDLETADRWEDGQEEGEVLYQSTHGHWVLYCDKIGQGWIYIEIKPRDALDFFVRNRLEVPAALGSVALYHDLDINGARHNPAVKCWPAGANRKEPVIFRTADGRWILDEPEQGERRYRELSAAGALRYFRGRGWDIPEEFIEEADRLPFDLWRVVHRAFPVWVEEPLHGWEDDGFSFGDDLDEDLGDDEAAGPPRFPAGGYGPPAPPPVPPAGGGYSGPVVETAPDGKVMGVRFGDRYIRTVSESSAAFLSALRDGHGEWVVFEKMCEDRPALKPSCKSKYRRNVERLFPGLKIQSSTKGFRLSPEYWGRPDDE